MHFPSHETLASMVALLGKEVDCTPDFENIESGFAQVLEFEVVHEVGGKTIKLLNADDLKRAWPNGFYLLRINSATVNSAKEVEGAPASIYPAHKQNVQLHAEIFVKPEQPAAPSKVEASDKTVLPKRHRAIVNAVLGEDAKDFDLYSEPKKKILILQMDLLLDIFRL